MIKKKMKTFMFMMAGRLSPSRLISELKRGPVVLIYHGVEERLIDARVQTLHIPIKTFEQQMKFLQRNAEVISLHDLRSHLSDDQGLNPSEVLITFDDGYKNNWTIAAPVLDAFKFPFSVFVSTRHIEERLRFPAYRLKAAIHHAEKKTLFIRCLDSTFELRTDSQRRQALMVLSRLIKTSWQPRVESIIQDVTGLISKDRWLEIDHLFSSEEPLSWEEISRLSQKGVVIGSHCHDHFILHAAQSAGDVEFQLKISKNLIERHANRCGYIAYPNGGRSDITREFLKKVKENGYLLGFSAMKGEISRESDPLLLPRIFVPDDYEQFKFRTNNGFLYSLRYSRWARGLRNEPLNGPLH